MSARSNIVVTGMGIISPIGTGVQPFTDGLRQGRTNFSTINIDRGGKSFQFPIAKVDDFDFKSAISGIGLPEEIINKAKRLRNVSQSALYGVFCALEAWCDAGLHNAAIDFSRVAIVSGGSNTQQSALLAAHDDYREKLQFLNPNYGVNFFDTDIIGILSHLLGITGEGFSVGAASASGNMAIIQASRLIAGGDYDVVLTLAPLMDISVYEYQAFTALGAMAPLTQGLDVKEICRPFDKAHCGFVYGQCAGSMIIESAVHAQSRARQSYGAIAGFGLCMDANRGPDPSVNGEKTAMLHALQQAGITAADVDYVNTHGTASPTGDDTEANALLAIGFKNVKANSTKSLMGHGLTAAGLTEAIACFAQMKNGFVHRSNNLTAPITNEIDWIVEDSRPAVLKYVLNNSFGFGGVNTSVIFKNNL